MPPKGGQRNFRQGLSGLVDLMAYSVALFIYYYVLQESISSVPVFSSFSTHLSHKAQGHQQHHQSQHQSQTVWFFAKMQITFYVNKVTHPFKVTWQRRRSKETGISWHTHAYARTLFGLGENGEDKPGDDWDGQKGEKEWGITEKRERDGMNERRGAESKGWGGWVGRDERHTEKEDR